MHSGRSIPPAPVAAAGNSLHCACPWDQYLNCLCAPNYASVPTNQLTFVARQSNELTNMTRLYRDYIGRI